MMDTETYIIIVGIAGLYVGLLIGSFLHILQNKKTDRKIRGHYRDLTQSDKIRVTVTLTNIAENYNNLTALIPVGQLKQSANHIYRLIYELKRLFTE